MQKRNFFKLVNIVYLFSTIFYIGIAIWAFVLCNDDFTDKTGLLGILIIISSVPHLLVFIADRKRISYLVIGLVGVAFGVLFIVTKDLFSDDQACMIWGIIDICRGLTEIINVVPKVKHHKGELVEIGISTGDIVIGVLLCIHMKGGLKLHLIYLGIAFIVSALKNINDFLLERFNHEKSSNPN